MRTPQREPTANWQSNQSIAIPEVLRANRSARNTGQVQAKTRANKLGSRNRCWRKLVLAIHAADLFFRPESPNHQGTNCPCTRVYPMMEELITRARSSVDKSADRPGSLAQINFTGYPVNRDLTRCFRRSQLRLVLLPPGPHFGQVFLDGCRVAVTKNVDSVSRTRSIVATGGGRS